MKIFKFEYLFSNLLKKYMSSNSICNKVNQYQHIEKVLVTKLPQHKTKPYLINEIKMNLINLKNNPEYHVINKNTQSIAKNKDS